MVPQGPRAALMLFSVSERAWTIRWPAAALARVLELVAERPLLADAVFAFVLFAVSASHLGHDPTDPPVVGWLLDTGLYAPIAFRRRAPFPAFMAVAAVALVQWYLGIVMPLGDVAVLIALYAVAAAATLRRLFAALCVMGIGVVLARVQWGGPGDFSKTFFLLAGVSTAAAVLGLNVRTRRAYLASLEDRARRLEHERDQQARIAAADERALIAREIHDIVTHSLSVMVALTDGASYALPAAPDQAALAVGKASEVGRQAITEMQHVLGILRDIEPETQFKPRPGLDQLEVLLSAVRAAGLPVELVIAGAAPPLSSGIQLAVYRVVQEALTNTRKYAAPGTTARVSLRYRAEHVDVEVTDDGRPPLLPVQRPAREGSGMLGSLGSLSSPGTLSSLGTLGDSGGHGIAGMRERVAVYGGELQAGPLAAGGWRIQASLTIKERRA